MLEYAVRPNTGRIRLNEGLANELGRVLFDEKNRLLAHRRKLLDEGLGDTSEFNDVRRAIKRVETLQAALGSLLREKGWGDYGVLS